MVEYADDREFNIPTPREQVIFLIAEICQEENKKTRHAIAAKLSENAIESGMSTKMLFEPKAHEIVMNARTS